MFEKIEKTMSEVNLTHFLAVNSVLFLFVFHIDGVVSASLVPTNILTAVLTAILSLLVIYVISRDIPPGIKSRVMFAHKTLPPAGGVCSYLTIREPTDQVVALVKSIRSKGSKVIEPSMFFDGRYQIDREEIRKKIEDIKFETLTAQLSLFDRIRDVSFFSFLFVVFFGGAAFFQFEVFPIALAYVVFLISQFVVATRIANRSWFELRRF